MQLEIKTRQDLTLDLYRRVAWNGGTISIADETLEKIDATREEFDQYMADHPDLKLYGYNIGAGDGARQLLTPDEAKEYLHGLGSGVSFGPDLPQRVVRGIVVARMPGIINGNSAVRSVFAEHIVSMLEREELPHVPMVSGGAGEINPLGMLFGNIPEEIQLVKKEPMVLINGHPCASSMACDAYLRSVGTVKLIEEVFGFVADALEAPMMHFAPQLELVWDDPDDKHGLQVMRTMLEGYTTPRREMQALTSIRDMPIMLSALYKAQRQLKEIAATMLKSVSDNPIFVPAAPGVEPNVMSNGSYHCHNIIVAIDQLNRVYADICAQFEAFINGFYLDDKAIPSMDNTCLGVLMMPGSAWMDEARMYATPSVLSGPQPGQNDLTTTTFQAFRKNLQAEKCVIANAALASVLAAQSFDETGRTPAPYLVPVFETVREVFPVVTKRRNIGDKIQLVYDRFREDSFAYSAADEKPEMVLHPQQG